LLLAVDVGNTQTVLGLFDGERLETQWRLTTARRRTADELEVELVALLHRRGHADAVDAACLSLTVPSLAAAWQDSLRRIAGVDPVVVGPGVRTGMPVRYDNPHEIGPDRIINAVAAHRRFGGPCIVVDFGTSTNFDVVSGAGEFIGGVLAPGIEVSMDALFARAARLGTVELVAPPTAIGKNTVAAMQSGAVYGFAGQVDGIVRRIQAELGGPCPVVATGGLAALVRPHSETITAHEPGLTLEGLRLVHDRNVAPA
jgi:type III pantothenate kinase